MAPDATDHPTGSPSMPEYAPLYPELPIRYEGFRRLSVFCEATEAGVRALLPEYLDYHSNELEVFLLHAPNVDGIEEYWEGGIITRAAYDGRVGGFMAAEFVTADAALGVGREIHGHPKKLADVTYEEDEAGIRGGVSRGGETLFSLSFERAATTFDVPDFTPRFHDRAIPSATGEGYDLRQCLVMELSGPPYVSDLDAAETDDQVHVLDTGTATVEFGESAVEPFAALAPASVIGATFVVRDFELGFADEAHDVDVQ
ncbi:acetoacetate decarboxylase family protein [Halorubellus salinus]|uniref:acetoacetate decarboxylase family protein n=1 Tax=Halorubellus salinus TaxID=755309 RepID=UPI001D06C630|nr:acetoacetate decarboxylase family protein [Halorubellus salinus]